MNTPPADLAHASILAALHEGWAIDPIDLRYAPLGFGSHHWTATGPTGERWFVTVDDLRASHLGSYEDESFSQLETAFRTALSLREDADLRFVVAPVAGADGEVLRRLGERYALSVFPFLDVVPSGFGEFLTREDREGAMRLVAQVHNATAAVHADRLRRDTLAVLGREALDDVLLALDDPWDGGPYAEPARQLLREHIDAVVAALQRFDALAALVMADDSGWVITHGEPHASNIVRTRSGEQVMVDWDTVAFGPPERDLWMLVDDDHPDWTPYREVTGIRSISGEAMQAYRLHWSLSEIAVYTRWFRERHVRTEDTEIAWGGLQQYVQNT